jgi:hypothetical protein
MKRIQWIIILICVLLVGCSSSNITSTWKSPSALELQTGKILVIGLIKESDKSLQRRMENHLADDLCNLGYDAVPSMDLYGPKTFEGQEEKTVINELKEKAFDAVLTIVLLNKQKHHALSSMNDLSGKYRYGDFYPYYIAIYNKIYEDGYNITDTYYYWQSNLYSLKDQKLIYSVQTQSFNPSNTAILAHEYGKMIVQDMLGQHIIKNLHP